MLASHLGPHPLLAEALHDRLADAGLARAGRARGLSIVTGVNGILVLADRGDEAIKEAGVTAVLLAARLAVPAVPASLGDAASVSTALTRLRETGASRPAISLCVIGPEAQPQEMKAIRSMLDAPSAPPIGAHPAIAQLIAIRYGAALARLAMASSAG
jgi:sirohydrochlorin ferrochelatase